MVDRAPYRCTCQAIALDDLGQACDGQPAQVEIVDLSASGAQLLNIPSIWRRGQPIQIDLELPKSTSSGNGSNAPQINTGNHRLSLKGRISWQAGGKAGLEFDFEHSQQAALDQAIRQAEKSLIGKQPLSDLRAADLRLPVHHLCWIEPAFTPQEHSQRRTAALENLSLGGARLNMQSDTALTFTQSDQAFSDLDWQVGKAVRIGLSYPDWPGELKLQGLVRWRQSHFIGIAFDSNPQEQMRLEQFLQTVINARRFSVGQLRSYLKARLADYMLPSAFVLMDALPLTPNGKIDRKALPAPDWSQADWGEEYIAPRTPTETKLAEIWGQVLGRQSSSHIGVRDNFFNLGGHSLLATQLVSRIRQVFEIDLPLRNVFEYPTLEELAERVEILLRGGYSLQAGAITPIPRQGELPLSFAQQRMWFLDQLEPGSPFYNIPEAVRLTGNLDVSALHRSLQIVVQRHEILRTNFHTRDGKPVPEIHPELNLPLQVDDLSHLPPAEREARAQQIAQQEAQTAFDLSCGPLLRARLVRLEKDDHIVLLTMHHIIGDDWSTRVMISEISAIYSAITQGQDPSLPDLPIQYVDYAAWQRGWLQGKVLEEQLAYWKRQLAGCPPLLELPTDRPRPAVQSFKGSYLTFSLSPQLTKSLRLLCQQEGVTQFMLLLAAFQALLHRYSGQDDICVGTPIANRNRADIEPLIGFFVNTLVLHTTFRDRMTFRELMQQVRECCLGAYAHQDVPFELVVDALQPERNLSQSPLFQVMFVIQNAPGEAQQIPGLTIQPIEAHSGTAKFDLTLFMLEEYERLGGAVEYCTDLFDAATIERMLEHFQNILESAVADPDQFVEHLPLLGAAELHQLLHAWNDTIAPPLAGDNLPCVQQMIEEQVQRTPDAIAVTQVLEIDGAVRSLTYRELNARANQLAHALRQIGAGPDTLVCVCMDRSLELLVGLLGILKAGSAYVPLDPTYPVDRLAYMLEDVAQWGEREIPAVQTGIHALSKPVILITQRASLPLFESLPIGRSGLIHIICLDEIWEKRENESSSTSRTESARSLNKPGGKFELEIGRQPVTNPACLTIPDHLAYVIYTSGSTGRPKGVMITHGGLSNYLHWCLRAYPLEQGSGSPVHSSISFDLTVTSLFSPLLVGRQAVLLPESLGPQALGELLLQVNQSHVDEPSGSWHPQTFSLIKITPAHLKLLGEMIPAQQASRLTHAFVIGGENLLPEHVDFWQTYAPGTRLFNEYGPTETVVGCCVYELPPKTSEATPCRPTANGALPIGRPIINTCLYVLDKHQQPTPLGVHGELYIGGAGVARGYINRPDLTSERFIPNPFTPAEAGANRLYRTGDLAYYLPDGNLVCLGRVDFQVKIRGFRVELGEIESLLNQHELVHESVAWVLVQNGHKRLVAYVVLQDWWLISLVDSE
jgi:amino acid adenylation domain-containing protein